MTIPPVARIAYTVLLQTTGFWRQKAEGATGAVRQIERRIRVSGRLFAYSLIRWSLIRRSQVAGRLFAGRGSHLRPLRRLTQPVRSLLCSVLSLVEAGEVWGRPWSH